MRSIWLPPESECKSYQFWLIGNGAGDNRQWEWTKKIFVQATDAVANPQTTMKSWKTGATNISYPLSWDLWPLVKLFFFLSSAQTQTAANSVKPPYSKWWLDFPPSKNAQKLICLLPVLQSSGIYIYIDWVRILIIRFSLQQHVKKCLTCKPSHDSNPQVPRPTTSSMGCYPETRQLELFCSATCADDKSGQLPKIHDHYCPELVHCWIFPLEFNFKKLALNLGIFPRVENQ